MTDEYKNKLLNELVKSKFKLIKYNVAKYSCGLDTLITDKDWLVRWSVANQGYGLDTLINDKDENVRAAVARQNYNLHLLVKDKSEIVQRAILDTISGVKQKFPIMFSDGTILIGDSECKV